VAAKEVDRQRVVVSGGLAFGGQIDYRRALLPTPSSALTAPLVDKAARGDSHQPGPRVFRHTLVRPLLRRRQQGFLHCILARVELAVAPDQGAKDLRRQVAQQALDLAFRLARVSVSTSTSQKPTSDSFDSA
jgi:hypothetical protein